MKFAIRHRVTGAALFECELDGEFETASYAAKLGAAVNLAIKARANLSGADLSDTDLGGAYLRGADLRGAYLRGADLRGAYLRGAYLRGAYLGGADLGGAKLVGSRPVFQIGPLGSRHAYLVAFLTDHGVRVRAGCWFGSLDDFRAEVAKTHGDNEHGREYAAAIKMIEAHAEIWGKP